MWLYKLLINDGFDAVQFHALEITGIVFTFETLPVLYTEVSFQD